MEPGFKRTTIARILAGVGCLCGMMGLLEGLTKHEYGWGLSAHGWGTGGILALLIALFVLVDGMVSFEKSRLSGTSKP